MCHSVERHDDGRGDIFIMQRFVSIFWGIYRDTNVDIFAFFVQMQVRIT